MREQKESYGLGDFVSNVKDKGVLRALGNDAVETFNLYKLPQYEGCETVRQLIGGTVFGVGVLGTLTTLFLSPFIIMNKIDQAKRDGFRNVLWEEFAGNIPGYKVDISESHYENGGSQRLVHLDAIDEGTVPHRITGHDYGIDGHFERVFIMDEEFSSCDSVRFSEGGRAIWDPSPASEKSGKEPFTEEQIVAAQAKLYDSLASVRKEDNKYRHRVPGMNSEENWGLIDKSSE